MRRRRAPKWLEAAKAKGPDAPSDAGDFVSRALSRAGVMPSAAAEDAVRRGRVKVDGRRVQSPFAPVAAGSRVTVDGAVVDVAPTTRVLAFHKPRNVVVNGSDPHGGRTVFDALREVLAPELGGYGWLAVGRLDRDTTGLLLFTNDERFVAHATHPSTHLPKRYRVRVGGTVTDASLEALRRGVTYDDVVTRPAQVELRGPGELALTLTEGRFHQVKRMMNAVQLATLELHREAVGAYTLDVEEGAYRLLRDDEVRAQLGYAPRHVTAPSAPAAR